MGLNKKVIGLMKDELGGEVSRIIRIAYLVGNLL